MAEEEVTLNPTTKKFEAIKKEEGGMAEPEELAEKLPGEEDPPEEDGYGVQIRELLEEGHTGKQIIEMGFSKSTVIQEARKFVKKNGGTIMGGKGSGTGNGQSMFPVKLGKGDSIPIEAELDGIRLQDGEYKLGFTDGMRVIILGAKLNQMLIAGLSETTSSQLALLKEAKTDEKGVAQEAVLEMLPHFAEMMKETARASSPNPMASLMSRILEGPITQAMSGMFKMFPGMTPQAQPGQSNLPSGWQDARGGK